MELYYDEDEAIHWGGDFCHDEELYYDDFSYDEHADDVVDDTAEEDSARIYDSSTTHFRVNSHFSQVVRPDIEEGNDIHNELIYDYYFQGVSFCLINLLFLAITFYFNLPSIGYLTIFYISLHSNRVT
jgi:hypothetical protein